MTTKKAAPKTKAPDAPIRKPLDGLRIVRLEAENIKRVVAIAWTPANAAGSNIVGGNNGQGKTSVLDCIMLALGGKKAAKGTPKVIRDGETEGYIALDMDTLRVRRVYHDNGREELFVETKEGARLATGQSILDTLIGPLSFDPLAFTREKPEAQAATLMKLVDPEFVIPTLDAERTKVYGERTDVGRQLKSAKAVAEAAAAEVGGIDLDGPTLDEVLDQLEQARVGRERRAGAAAMVQSAQERVDNAERKVTETRAALAQAELAFNQAVENMELRQRQQVEINDTEPEVDEEALQQAKVAARDREAQAGKLAERDRMKEEAVSLARQYEGLTALLESIDGQKAAFLRGANLPIDGLDFDENGITYNGIPFSQASAAEQLRVSVAISAAQNPTLKVVRITDGALLDDASHALLNELLIEHGLQGFVEVVRTDMDGTLVIEAGKVAK